MLPKLDGSSHIIVYEFNFIYRRTFKIQKKWSRINQAVATAG